MEYDKTPDRIKIDGQATDEYFDRRDQSSLTGHRQGGDTTRGNKKNNALILLAGVVVLAVAVIAVTVLRRPGAGEDDLHLGVIGKRLKQVEIQMAKTEEEVQKLLQIKLKLATLEQLQERIKGVETELVSGMVGMEVKLAELKKQVALAAPSEPIPVNPKKKETPKKKATTRVKKPAASIKTKPEERVSPALSKGGNRMFHTVASGETLYRISIKYGVTVDELKRTNPGVTGNTIHTGQTLLIPVE